MAVFTYKAVSGDASAVSGLIVAETPREARDSLRARGLTVEEVAPRESGGAGGAAGMRGFFRRSGSRGDVARVNGFIRELSTLLGVGIPLVEAIDTIQSQHRGRFAAALLMLRDRIAAGASLADAMREQPDVFDELCAQIAQVGEDAGTLDTALERVAEFKERSAAFRNRIATVLIYPAVVVMMAIGVSVLLMTMVVPNLLDSLQSVGRPLPWPTRVVKHASDFLVHQWWVLLLVLAGIVVGVRLVLRTPRGRWQWHRAQLRIPIMGELIRKQAVVRLCVVLSTLLRSGLVFVHSLQIARRTTSNLILADALERCEAAVQTGRDIGESLKATGAFPPVVVRIFSVGQQSGRLEEMLDRLAVDYDRQVTTASQRLTAVLEPALILVLVVLVGFIGVATILPLLEAADVF
jgi:type II secretory pathway component PulF